MRKGNGQGIPSDTMIRRTTCPIVRGRNTPDSEYICILLSPVTDYQIETVRNSESLHYSCCCVWTPEIEPHNGVQHFSLVSSAGWSERCVVIKYGKGKNCFSHDLLSWSDGPSATSPDRQCPLTVYWDAPPLL